MDTYGRPRFGTAEEASVSGAGRGVGRGRVGAREWGREVGALRSSRTSKCASARGAGVVAGAVLGQCASGRPVAVSRSASMSAGGRKAPGSAAAAAAGVGDVNGSDCG
jgi:hypothetical protein